MAPETGNVAAPANGGEAPFRLSRDTQGNAILILGESRHNLGRLGRSGSGPRGSVETAQAAPLAAERPLAFFHQCSLSCNRAVG